MFPKSQINRGLTSPKLELLTTLGIPLLIIVIIALRSGEMSPIQIKAISGRWAAFYMR